MNKEMFMKYIENGNFVPFYQPKVDLRTNKIIGAEALVRLIVDKKIICPDDFVPFLEKENLTSILDLYIFKKVCEDIKKLENEGKKVPKISVNFSRKDIEKDNLADDIKYIIFSSKIDKKYLEFEITESAKTKDDNSLKDFIKKMHDENIKISIDDFGAGFTSLRMLTDIDIDTIKIDKYFIDYILKNPKKSKILMKNFMNICNELNIEVIAEGVETDNQIKVLDEANCYNIQGYFFYKPLSFESFKESLENI